MYDVLVNVLVINEVLQAPIVTVRLMDYQLSLCEGLVLMFMRLHERWTVTRSGRSMGGG